MLVLAARYFQRHAYEMHALSAHTYISQNIIDLMIVGAVVFLLATIAITYPVFCSGRDSSRESVVVGRRYGSEDGSSTNAAVGRVVPTERNRR